MYNPFTYDPTGATGQQYYSGMVGQTMAPNLFNSPTYGQFGLENEHMMATPYGGQFSAPSSNIYYSNLVAQPFKTFATYKAPLFSAAKGLNPIAFNQYYSEAQAQGTMSLASGAASFGGSIAGGAALGGMISGPLAPIGTVVGGVLGGMFGGALTHGLTNALSRGIQIHEASNLLNTGIGGNEFGFGLSMSQSNKLYKEMTKSAFKNPNFSSEEQQLAFTELAKNSLIDDTGDFQDIKSNIKKMKDVVEKLRDIYNGSIKDVVASLRQLNVAGVDTEDLLTVSTVSGVAAAQMGQNTSDYTRNLMNTANQTSAQTGLSKALSIQLQANVDANTDIIGKDVGEIYGKNISSKEKTLRFKDDLMNTINVTTFSPLSNMLMANNKMGSGQYIMSALTAGIQKYNKENGTDYDLTRAMTDKGFQEKIWHEGYAETGMKELMKKHNGNMKEVYSELAIKDKAYMVAFNNNKILSSNLKKVTSKEANNILMSHLDELFSDGSLIKFAKQSNLDKTSPELFNSLITLNSIEAKHPSFFKGIVISSQRRAQMAQEKNEELKNKRIYSGEGMIDSFKEYAKYVSSSIVSEFVPKEHISRRINHLHQNTNNIRDLYLASQGINEKDLSKQFLSADSLKSRTVGAFTTGLITKLFDSKDITDSAKRIKYLTGDYVSYQKEGVERIWAYNINRKRSLSRGMLALDRIKEGDFSGLSYFDNLTKKADNSTLESASKTDDKGVIKASDNKTAERIRKVVSEIKAHQGTKDKKVLERDAYIAKAEFAVANGGIFGLLQQLGYKDTLTKEGAEDLLEKLQGDKKLHSLVSSNISEKLHISKKRASSLLDEAIKDKDYEKRLTSNVLAFNTVSGVESKGILNDKQAGLFYKMGGSSKTIAAFNAADKDYDKLFKMIQDEATRGSDYDLDLKNGALDAAHVLTGKGNAKVTDLVKSIGSFFENKDVGDIKINGHTYNKGNYKDLFKNKADLTQFLKQQAAIGFTEKVGQKLGINGFDVKKANTFRELMSDAFKYNDETKEWEIKEKIDNTKVNKELQKLGLGKGIDALKNVKEVLNNSEGSLEHTNTILSRILGVMNEINQKTEKKSATVAEKKL